MHTMRKLSALAMVALLALTFAFALLGCGKKESAAEEAAEDRSEHSMDSTAMDTTMHTDSLGR